MNTQNTDDQISPWVRGLFILGISLAGVSAAVSAAKGGGWSGWFQLFCCQAVVFIFAGWQFDFLKRNSKIQQTTILTAGLIMTLVSGALIIAEALR